MSSIATQQCAAIFARLFREERGQGALEYVAVLLVVAAILAVVGGAIWLILQIV